MTYELTQKSLLFRNGPELDANRTNLMLNLMRLVRGKERKERLKGNVLSAHVSVRRKILSLQYSFTELQSDIQPVEEKLLVQGVVFQTQFVYLNCNLEIMQASVETNASASILRALVAPQEDAVTNSGLCGVTGDQPNDLRGSRC